MIHDGTLVIACFESAGITETIHTLFEGTREQVDAEIERLGLAVPPGTFPDVPDVSPATPPLLVAALPAFASATGMAETGIRTLLETCQDN